MIEFGRTVADVVAFLAKTDAVLLAVRVTSGTVTYLEFAPDVIRAALAGQPDGLPMPCEWSDRVGRRELAIGSYAAIAQSMVRP